MQHGVTRTISETNFSTRKKSKRQNQRALLAAMEIKTDEKDPRKLLKMLLLKGWIEEKGRITKKDSELTLVGKEFRRFNVQQSMNLIKTNLSN